jgi:hypothetical protein
MPGEKRSDRLARLEREIHGLRLDMEAEEKFKAGWAKEHAALIEAIPGCLPGGTGGFSPLGWVKWARGRLGYPEAGGFDS